MASTAAAQRLTEAHRVQQLAARAGSLRELVLLWRAVDVTDLSGTIETFARAAAILAGQGFEESGAISARYYGLFRRLEGVGGTAPKVAIAARPSTTALAADIRGAALKGIITARRSGLTVERAGERGLVRTMGAVGKLVLSGGRQTIVSATQNDRRALGWARVTSSGACAFCRMLASRGPAYKNEKTADFEAHDDCACSAQPVFGPDRNAKQAAEYAAEFAAAQRWARDNDTASRGTGNNALNNYRRYLAGEATASPSPATEVSG